MLSRDAWNRMEPQSKLTAGGHANLSNLFRDAWSFIKPQGKLQILLEPRNFNDFPLLNQYMKVYKWEFEDVFTEDNLLTLTVVYLNLLKHHLTTYRIFSIVNRV